MKRKYSDKYIEKANREIPLIASTLNEVLQEDKRLGACVDISGGLYRILEREGFWCYVTKGSLTIKFPSESKISTKYFWTIDDLERAFFAAHAWVVAPPFNIIDISVKQQSYTDNASDFLPNIICSKSNIVTHHTNDDIASPLVVETMRRLGYDTELMSLYKDNWTDFKNIFKNINHIEGGLSLKYIPTAITATIEPLEELTGYKPIGKSFLEIYEDIIKPKLKALRELNT